MLGDEIEEAVGGAQNLTRPVVNERRVRRPVESVNMFDWYGSGLVNNAAFTAGNVQGKQGQHLLGMGGALSDAIGDENSRRVAMAREMRRMEHERWKMMQQIELEKMRMQSDSANQIRALRMRAAQSSPWRSKTLRRDPMTGEYRWMEDWEM